MIAICPNRCNDDFETTAHVAQTWIVDKRGDFVLLVDDCSDVICPPDSDNIWTCIKCGAEAKFILPKTA